MFVLISKIHILKKLVQSLDVFQILKIGFVEHHLSEILMLQQLHDLQWPEIFDEMEPGLDGNGTE